jgi:predicted dehydrogenase
MALGIGLFGSNGHQILHQVRRNPHVKLVAVADFPADRLADDERQRGVQRYTALDQLLADDAVQLVSLCSARRADQADHAIRALSAGKHVYAEKPCALHEADLDAIVATAQRTGRRFHEMAGSIFAQPYLAIRRVVESGRLGTIVQVFAQKSYPFGDGRRPNDEAIDGGLTRQAGVHAFRFVEHLTGIPIVAVHAMETSLGNPTQAGGLRMASATLIRLANGAVGAITCNYLNQPKALGAWGNETVRLFGTNGFVEAVDGGQRTRLILHDQDLGPLDTSEPSRDYFDLFVDELVAGTPMPFPLDVELHPTRMVIRAKDTAQ